MCLYNLYWLPLDCPHLTVAMALLCTFSYKLYEMKSTCLWMWFFWSGLPIFDYFVSCRQPQTLSPVGSTRMSLFAHSLDSLYFFFWQQLKGLKSRFFFSLSMVSTSTVSLTWKLNILIHSHYKVGPVILFISSGDLKVKKKRKKKTLKTDFSWFFFSCGDWIQYLSPHIRMQYAIVSLFWKK